MIVGVWGAKMLKTICSVMIVGVLGAKMLKKHWFCKVFGRFGGMASAEVGMDLG